MAETDSTTDDRDLERIERLVAAFQQAQEGRAITQQAHANGLRLGPERQEALRDAYGAVAEALRDILEAERGPKLVTP